MSKPELSPTPSWRTIASAQLRMLALLQRRDFIALGSIVVALAGLSVWGIFRASPPNHPPTETLMVFALLAIPLALVAALWPMGVWRQESPTRRGYFWALPASRGPHTFVRVGAGWVLLMTACVAIMIVTWLLLLLALVRLGPAELSLARWYVPLATATLAYVLVTPLAVLFDGPMRVLVWTCLAVSGVRLVAQVTRLEVLAGLIDGVVKSLGLALVGPLAPHDSGPEVVFNSTTYTIGYAVWGANYLIWIAIGVAALLLVAFRYREAR